MKIHLKYATFEVLPDLRSVSTTFPDGLQSIAFRDEHNPDDIRQAHSEGYKGNNVVWRSLIDHELLHSIVAEVAFDRPPVVLRTEAGGEFYPLWERYEEEMLVLSIQQFLNTRVPCRAFYYFNLAAEYRYWTCTIAHPTEDREAADEIHHA